MIDIALEYFHHLALIFRWICVEVFYERNEVGIGGVGDLLVLDELKNVVVALKLFFTTVYSSLYSFGIFFVGFVVHSRVGHVGHGVLFLQGYLETETIGLYELEFIGLESLEELLKPLGEIMTWVFVDGCGIQIHEEVLKSEFLHTGDGLVRIGVVEVFPELGYETVVVVTGTVVVDKVRQECPDSVNPRCIFDVLGRIEDSLIESSENRAGFGLEGYHVHLRESEFGEISSGYLTEDLLEFPETLYSAKIIVEDFFQCRIFNIGNRGIKYLFF